MPNIGNIEGTIRLNDQYSRELTKFNSLLGSTTKSLTRFGGALGVSFGVAGAAAFVKSVVKTAAAYESLRVQLETVEGSAAAAKRTFDGLQQFAAKTPFQVDQLTRSWVQFRAIGLAPTADDLRAVGDLAAAFGRSIEDATLAVTRAAFGETEALKSFGIAAKVEGDKLRISFRGVEQSVNRDAKSITDALIGLAETNFAGSMERQSETLNGVLSTLDDNVKILKASIGEQLLPALKDLAKFMIEAAKHSGEATAVIRATWNGAAAAILSAAAAESKIRAALMSLNPLLRDQAKELKAQSEEWERLAFKNIVATNTALDDYGKAAQKAAAQNADLESSMIGGGGGGGAGGGVAGAADKVAKSISTLGQKLYIPPDKIGNLWFPPGTVDEIVKRYGDALEQAELRQKRFMPPDKVGLLWFPPGTAREIAARANEATTKGMADNSGDASIKERFRGLGKELEFIIAQALLDAFLGDGINWQQVGRQIGEAIGFALAGPIGGAIGAIIGDALGKLAGGDPNKSQGSFTLSQDFRGQGGVDSMQDAFAAALDAMDQILARIEEITNGALWLSEQMEVIVNKQGDAILKIRDAQGNEILSQAFASQQEAMDAGLARLLSTAVLNAEGPLANAFQEVLANAANAGLEATLESLEKLGEIDQFLQSIDPTFDSTLNRIAQFRSEIEGMGLSAEVAADILRNLQDAENQRLQTLQSGWYSELFQIWQKLGVNQTELANERAKMEQLQAQITLQRLRAEAEFYGFLTPALEAIINGLLEAANDIANFRVDLGGVGKIGKIKVGKIGKGTTGGGGPSKKDLKFQLLEELERFLDSGKSRSLNAQFAELRKQFFGPGGFLERAKELGVPIKRVTEAFRAAAQQLRETAFSGIRDVLRDLRLGTGGFGGASMSQQFFSQQSEFGRLAALARGGDLDAAQQLGEFSRTYIETIRSMFGGSRRGRQLIEQVQSSLEGIVGVGEDKQTMLSTERNHVLYDIRELLGGDGRPMEDMAKTQRESLTEFRRHTALMRTASEGIAETARETKRAATELEAARREKQRGTFKLSASEVKYVVGGSL